MLASGAAGSTRADPGITPTAIVIGAADPASANARGATAYFRHVNARGGVRGRSIVLRPAADDVFAVLGSASGWEQLPQLFADFGLSARAEGWILGSYLARARPGARVGVLYADDEEGRELLVGLRQGIARSTVRVALVRIELDTLTDVEALHAAGADVLALFTPSSRGAAREAVRLGWRPHVVVASDDPGGVEGAISTAVVKDPADPAWRDDAALRPFRSVLSRDLRFVEGMAAAYELVRVLRAAGKEPTRAAATAAARRLNDASNPYLLPGIVVRTSATDRFPVEQAQLRRWSQGRWRSFGGLWAHRG